MAANTPVNGDIEGLRDLIVRKKDEIKRQFEMLRANLDRKEQELCAQLDELDKSRASLEATLKENHVLGLLEKTVVDLDNEKERLLERDNEIPKNLQLLWNLEPFVKDLEKLCAVQLSSKSEVKLNTLNFKIGSLDSWLLAALTNFHIHRVSLSDCFEKKVVNLRRMAGQSFGFVIMSDANHQTSICRIAEGSAAHLNGLRVGDVLIQMNGQDVSNLTHAQIVERIKNWEYLIYTTVTLFAVPGCAAQQLMNTGKSTLLGWCLFTIAGGGALFFTRREYLATKQRQRERAYISDKNLTWRDILKYEEERLKLEEQQKGENQPPPTDGTS